MIHFDEEQLVQAYYGDIDEASRQHLDDCEECREEFRRLKSTLDSAREYPVPARKSSYGSEVWLRLLPHLPSEERRHGWFRWWVLAPALATLVVVAFIAGMLTEQRQTGISAKSRERVLLMAISDHLDRSQILLTELVHEDAESASLQGQRDRARELLTENRLLRQSAAHMGDATDADLLEALERVLLDVANSSTSRASNDLQMIQQRIDNEALLFKVRITGADAR
ncbi:MAG TPA: hypothetical protein VH601_20050, partial [Bryobacteraceae bacterium]